MRVYGVIYGTKVIGFCVTKREAEDAAYEYGAKVGPDPEHPRENHFREWAKLHGRSDCRGAWEAYVLGVEDNDVGIMTVSVPLWEIRTLVCLGLDGIQKDISKKLGDLQKPGGRGPRSIKIDPDR